MPGLRGTPVRSDDRAKEAVSGWLHAATDIPDEADQLARDRRDYFRQGFTRLFGQFLGLNKLYPVVVMPPF
ncbi:hypothetical protein [Gluconobacter japonicus]|uniref:Uncharacterized protein n=1 Tax=Gluconobacter japonicus TaxID=376620 RepID=A0ABQ5WDQ8_GLUJA|nr:hypothetical protein [Gluconobacter japonicus]GLQ58262.1 hypothetical protein GCM10010937_00630 [Gluconobacter japonicus]